MDQQPSADFVSRYAGAETPETDFSLSDLPRWLVITAGGLGAAVMGALLGGALHL